MIGAITRRVRFLLLCAAVIAGFAAVAWVIERQTATIAGRARVIDGDSLRIADTEIRLFGIDAPEYGQTCLRAGRPWRCGLDATEALRAAVRNKEIVCRPRDRDRYGRTVAVCHAGELDLAAAMVKGGFAVSEAAYDADEREARDAGRGVWSSSFDHPAKWRALHPRPPR
jgi:endonuclease YncB( thermonuclease family)